MFLRAEYILIHPGTNITLSRCKGVIKVIQSPPLLLYGRVASRHDLVRSTGLFSGFSAFSCSLFFSAFPCSQHFPVLVVLLFSTLSCSLENVDNAENKTTGRTKKNCG